MDAICQLCGPLLPGKWDHHVVLRPAYGMRWHVVKKGQSHFQLFWSYKTGQHVGTFELVRPNVIDDYSSSMEYAMTLQDLVKKARAKKDAKASAKMFEDPAFSEKWPTVHAFLTLTEGDKKGEDRLTSTLMICVDEGVAKASLNDREECASLWASSDTFWGALDALEGKLEGGTKEWRSWNGTKGKKKKA